MSSKLGPPPAARKHRARGAVERRAAELERLPTLPGAPPPPLPIPIQRDPVRSRVRDLGARYAAVRGLERGYQALAAERGVQLNTAELRALVRRQLSSVTDREGATLRTLAGIQGARDPDDRRKPEAGSAPGSEPGRVAGIAGASVQPQTNSVSAKANRRRRYELQQGVRDVTGLARVRGCGRRVSGELVELRAQNGTAYWSGVWVCGRLWFCPSCAAKISARRAGLVGELLGKHATAGGDAAMSTLTAPHYASDRLAESRRVIPGAFRRVIAGRSWTEARERWGIVGQVRALETTHGRAHGWHVHIHALWCFARPLTRKELRAFSRWLKARWAEEIYRATGRVPDTRRALKVERVVADDDGRRKLADYLAKSSAANEVTRLDAKRGSAGGRTPFQILRDLIANRAEARKLAGLAELEREDGHERRARALEAAELVVAARVTRDWQLWREWETVMPGARHLTWSRGLRARYEIDDKSDDELAQEQVDGEIVAELEPELYRALARRGALVRTLEEAEQGRAQLVTFLEHFCRRTWDDDGKRRPGAAGSRLYLVRAPDPPDS